MQTASGEPTGHVTGSASEVAAGSAGAGFFDQHGEERTIERLVHELITQAVGVVLGDRVVAATQGPPDVVGVHAEDARTDSARGTPRQPVVLQ